jgi:4-diphosphocytidyl-2-C-methyl-D-erythritol kinase
MADKVRLCAPAKVNLTLGVRGRLPSGYHALESLVAFAAYGDVLTFEKASATSFASNMSGGNDNLVMRAHDALQSHIGQTLPVAIRLQKNLPIAAGLGGGSSDAAACLRGLIKLFALPVSAADLSRLALSLGADVPVCLAAQPAWMTDIGGALTPIGDLPAADIVLVNPRQALSTPLVFDTLQAGPLAAAKPLPPVFSGFDVMADYLRQHGNDLQAPALSLVADIADCLKALVTAGGHYVAMSGSGSSCFALCPTGEGAAIAQAYGALRADDWLVATALVSARNAEIDELF